jgi:hypothetical protein
VLCHQADDHRAEALHRRIDQALLDGAVTFLRIERSTDSM